MKKLKSLDKSATKFFVVNLLLGVGLLIACGNDGMSSDADRPFLNIEKGQFNVSVIVVDVTDDGSGPRGSGTLSFDFLGDLTGSFSASGQLTTGQTEPEGVGAVITKIENSDFDRFDEVISLLAFNPTGNGKADVFILGSTTPVDSLQTGLSYLINPLGPFTTAVFLNGIGIQEFWAGATNLLEATDNAFFLEAGLVSINARNGTTIRGTFEGTTHTGQGSFLRKIRN